MTTTTTAAPVRRSAARTRDLVLAVLAEAPGPATVTELAEAAGVARSTLGKHMPALEKDGLAVRTPGGREGRRRLPDRWEAAPAPETVSVDRDGPETDRGTAFSEVEAATSTGDGPEVDQTADPADTDTDTDTVPEGGDAAQAEPVPDRGESTPAAEVPEAGTATAPAAAPAPVQARPGAVSLTGAAGPEAGVNPVTGSTRLAPGQLKLMVRAILDSEPAEEFTATAISHLLQGRSIGAIQNNLARLAKEGYAVLACERPRRYRSIHA
ncbi:winged helix-turn-helix domain-containing protein [Nocardiopsis sp. CNT312]|uniref:winged helix-turn-helix domain-containing protein n=1 Tax=Nocardiopsis sp. CNT312 TaxID=1137268 RepID=UPI00048F89E5|nr:winged helix-turn-helix domain-containing protein [Nocardiopsis sp. CNT312]